MMPGVPIKEPFPTLQEPFWPRTILAQDFLAKDAFSPRLAILATYDFSYGLELQEGASISVRCNHRRALVAGCQLSRSRREIHRRTTFVGAVAGHHQSIRAGNDVPF